MTTLRMTSALLRDLAGDPKVGSWFTDSDGLWISLADGWQYDSLHCIHVEPCDFTVSAVRRQLAGVEPCACADCAK